MLEPVIFDTLCNGKSAHRDTASRTAHIDRGADISVRQFASVEPADRNVRAPAIT